jgi:hypothetical protein
MRPLFLLSLPRSGSTLAQRVLGAHPQIATQPEPWIMLPLLSISRMEGVRADYWHESSAEAVRHFVARIDGGYEGWKEELRTFAERLYARAGGEGADYFLDKTPRYHVIAHELMELFEDGRFVFLWRHPLAVAASLLETFRAGRFEPYHFAIDLYGGIDGLLRAHAAADERCHSVRYEDLLDGPEGWAAMHDFLGLDFDPSVLSILPKPEQRASYGDPTGVDRYAGVSDEPLQKWRAYFRGPVRRRWAASYLNWIGEARMATMGYSLTDELAALGRTGGGLGAPGDAVQLLASRRASRARHAALKLPEGPPPLGQAFVE